MGIQKESGEDKLGIYCDSSGICLTSRGVLLEISTICCHMKIKEALTHILTGSVTDLEVLSVTVILQISAWKVTLSLGPRVEEDRML
jgi:hypothetical protein